MRSVLVLIALVGAAVAAPASAEVYKCKGPGGASIYSQQPCGAGAAVVKTRKQPVVDATLAESQRNTVFRSVDLNNAGYVERDCVSRAASNVLRPSNERLAGYQRQIRGLNADMGRANNNAAGAAWQAGLRSQVAGLEQAAAMERGSADSRMDGERKRCAAERASAAEAIEKKYSPDKP